MALFALFKIAFRIENVHIPVIGGSQSAVATERRGKKTLLFAQEMVYYILYEKK